METQQLNTFLDQVIESAYQARVFAKEGVGNVLQITELIKNKLIQNDALVNENAELKVKIEALENVNKNYKERFDDLDSVIEDSKQEVDATEIDVTETPAENLAIPLHSKNGTVKSHK